MTKLTPDEAIDIAYDTFLEMAPENLDPADILLFNLQFEERGGVEIVETSDSWDQEIGTLIDPDAFVEVWVSLYNDQDEIDDVFARFLISHHIPEGEDQRECHVIWKE
ncbi:hypothetical protein A1D22_07530 [Pasteurellaceae bacterium LFhippo2]|nr:hypothetical protein [Pasteurellaceae bacterium LFhippo2]